MTEMSLNPAHSRICATK